VRVAHAERHNGQRFIGNLEKTSSWGAGIEQQSIGFATYTLYARSEYQRLDELFRAYHLACEPREINAKSMNMIGR
jgi:hypothetical protein